MKLLVKIRALSRAQWLYSNDRVWEPEEASRQAKWQCLPLHSQYIPWMWEWASKVSRSLSSLFLFWIWLLQKNNNRKGVLHPLADLLCNIHDLRCPGLNPVTYLCDLGHSIILCHLKSKIICYSVVFIRVWLICKEIYTLWKLSVYEVFANTVSVLLF